MVVMESCALSLPASFSSSSSSSNKPHLFRRNKPTRRRSFLNINNAATSDNAASHHLSSSKSNVGQMHRRLSSLESLFCYDKAVPEEIIEKPVGLSMAQKNIGNKTACSACEAKGAILCATCSGSGLYVDSIMESQGIIVKVRCLGGVWFAGSRWNLKELESSILLTNFHLGVWFTYGMELKSTHSAIHGFGHSITIEKDFNSIPSHFLKKIKVVVEPVTSCVQNAVAVGIMA